MKAKVRTTLEIKNLLYFCDLLSFVFANSNKYEVRINFIIICRVRINKLTDQMFVFLSFGDRSAKVFNRHDSLKKKNAR